MSEKPLDQRNLPEEDQSEIVVNEYGETRDPAVVVDEPDRTVLLTDSETVVIDKEPRIDVVPANRPRKVYGGMWGQTELITMGLALFAVLTVVLIYIFLVIPANRENENNRAQREKLQTELLSATEKYGGITDTQTHVEKLMASVDDFESNNLPIAENGRTALYQRVNGLIAAYNLIPTSGPDYAALETADQDAGVQSDEERGRSKYKSLFPGVYVTMTVEGSYQNLRRFIREIETGREFVVVSAVELEPSEAEQQRPGQNNQNPNQVAAGPNTLPDTAGPVLSARERGKMHGEIVSLRLEMAAYFRRPNAVPAQMLQPPAQQ